MKRISKEKRDQLILVGLVTVGLIVGLYFGLIRSQQKSLQGLAAQQETTNTKLNQIADAARNNLRIESDLAAAAKALDAREQDMAQDDYYLWMVDGLRKFVSSYNGMEIQQYANKGASDMSLLPKFPYKQFTVGIIGTGHFHDIGKFIADFENRYPASRIMNLEFSPDASGQTERLVFRMEIATLIRPAH